MGVVLEKVCHGEWAVDDFSLGALIDCWTFRVERVVSIGTPPGRARWTVRPIRGDILQFMFNNSEQLHVFDFQVAT